MRIFLSCLSRANKLLIISMFRDEDLLKQIESLMRQNEEIRKAEWQQFQNEEISEEEKLKENVQDLKLKLNELSVSPCLI